MSLLKQTATWGDLKAAYRLLSNPEVTPGAIQTPHREHVRRQCVGRGLVLVVQDSSDLDFSHRPGTKNLGLLNRGDYKGLLQHTTLAVTPAGELLGILDQGWVRRKKLVGEETRTQRKGRWRESLLWPDSVRAVGPAPEGCRFMLVADSGADCFQTMRACDDEKTGFTLRAGRDRNVEDGADKLWTWAGRQDVRTDVNVEVRAQRQGGKYQPAKIARTATVSIRFGRVTLDPPLRSGETPRTVWVVYAREDHPPQDEGVEPIDWMLLCSEPVESVEAAREALDRYSMRWVIEEWHKALKQGCRLESSQLDDGADIERLAAVLSVVAVRLMQVRDLADGPDKDDPKALNGTVPEIWIKVVSVISKVPREEMTPRRFWLAVARKGGFLGRKSDGRPGWKTVFQGWYDFSQMVCFAEANHEPPQCG